MACDIEVTIWCPPCDGRGRKRGKPCIYCDGSGRVDDGLARRRAIGEFLQTQRRKRFATIEDEARRVGVKPGVLAAIERGTFRGELPVALRADAGSAGDAFDDGQAERRSRLARRRG